MDNTPNYINSPVEQKPSRKKTIWLVLIILALIASNTGWALFYLKQQGEMTAKINTLTAQNAKLTKDNKDLQNADSKTDNTAEYREIPELGVEYKLDDNSKKLIYVYTNTDKIPTVLFSTTDIQNLPMEQGDTDSVSSFSLGAIGKYTTKQLEGFSFLEKNFATFSKDNPRFVKKVGDYTYILTAPTGYGASTKDKASANSTIKLDAVLGSLKASN